MLKIGQANGAVVAADTQDALHSYDAALLSSARVMTSVIEVSRSSGVPASASQRVLDELNGGTSLIVEARGHFTNAIRHMADIQSQSDIRETSFGCPNGLPGLAGASATGIPLTKAADQTA